MITEVQSCKCGCGLIEPGETVVRGYRDVCYRRALRHGDVAPLPVRGNLEPIGASEIVEGWKDRAACSGVDPEIFFPLVPNHRLSRETIERATSFCRRCPVREVCRAWAEQFPETEGSGGIFGGVFYRHSGRELLV